MREKVYGCYLGVAIGDALGMPVETMSRQEIREKFPEGILGFVDAVQDRIPEQSDFKAGRTTDDWQLTRAINQSLISCEGFEITDIAKRHLIAYEQSSVGWGRSTREGIISLLKSRPPTEEPPYNPGSGYSNGVAMKVAPLGCYMALVNDGKVDVPVLWDWVCQLRKLTHTHPEAWESAFAVAYIVCRVMKEPYWTVEEARDLLKEVCEALAQVAVDQQPDTVLSRLRWAVDHFQDPWWITKRIGRGWAAKESVVYSILVALSFGVHFKKGLLYAVNDGGDSDTTASIVGAIMGANGGYGHIPPKWKEFSPDISAAKQEAKALCDSVL